jgi:hypothetical protein
MSSTLRSRGCCFRELFSFLFHSEYTSTLVIRKLKIRRNLPISLRFILKSCVYCIYLHWCRDWRIFRHLFNGWQKSTSLYLTQSTLLYTHRSKTETQSNFNLSTMTSSLETWFRKEKHYAHRIFNSTSAPNNPNNFVRLATITLMDFEATMSSIGT